MAMDQYAALSEGVTTRSPEEAWFCVFARLLETARKIWRAPIALVFVKMLVMKIAGSQVARHLHEPKSSVVLPSDIASVRVNQQPKIAGGNYPMLRDGVAPTTDVDNVQPTQ
ncbi:hypothetical protein AGR9A_Lc50107 [Agrobacterium salinitolerans str. Hayward 0363]|nr:hypothetical protein AGR9A_Lc50107 [Agrobacterium salinitolerans str. Hayward 0363]